VEYKSLIKLLYIHGYTLNSKYRDLAIFHDSFFSLLGKWKPSKITSFSNLFIYLFFSLFGEISPVNRRLVTLNPFCKDFVSDVAKSDHHHENNLAKFGLHTRYGSFFKNRILLCSWRKKKKKKWPHFFNRFQKVAKYKWILKFSTLIFVLLPKFS